METEHRPQSITGSGRGEAMSMLGSALLVLLVTAAAIPAANAESCDGATSVGITVQQAPLSVRTDFSLTELNTMPMQRSQAFRHPVLGLYASRVGYRLTDVSILPQADGGRCPRIRVQAELVAVDRRIEIGSDLLSDPCRFDAALAHYRRHATTASLALQQFAIVLPRQLQPQVNHYIASYPVRPATDDAALRNHVSRLLDESVDAFSRSLGPIQADVDSPGEVRSLVTACDGL